MKMIINYSDNVLIIILIIKEARESSCLSNALYNRWKVFETP
jgi:hypothetical protein